MHPLERVPDYGTSSLMLLKILNDNQEILKG